MKHALLAVIVLVGCTQAPEPVPAPVPIPTAFAQVRPPDVTKVGDVTWFVTKDAALTVGESLRAPGSVMLTPCGKWLSVESVTPGQAKFKILAHEPSESEHPYLIGYECLPSGCPGGEYMAWPDGGLGSRVTFFGPAGASYHVIVAKFVLVGADPGTWTPTRGCATVEITPAP